MKVQLPLFCLFLLTCMCQPANNNTDMKPSDSDTFYQFSKNTLVSPEKMFNSFLDPLTLEAIWGVSSITIDPRPGGKAIAKLHIDHQNRDFTLTYKEIVRNEKLLWVVRFDSFPEKQIQTTLWFKKTIDGTALTVRQENFSGPQERDENRKAWEAAVNKLEALISWK